AARSAGAHGLALPLRGGRPRRPSRARGGPPPRTPPAPPRGPAMTTPLTKPARHARIADILAREQVRSQEELADLLERYAGVHVTQATLSRDLDELGIVRLRSGGALVYSLPEEPGGPGSHPGGAMARTESPHDARLARYLGEL